MPSYRPPAELTSKQLRGIAATLSDVSERLITAAGRVETAEATSVYVFGSTTAERGIGYLTGFAREIDDAVIALTMGRPYGPNSQKTKTGVKTVSEEAAEIRGEMDRASAQRTAKRQTTTHSASTRRKAQ